MSNKICVYTDGSCLNNGKKNSIGGIGVYFSDNDPDNYGQVIDNEGNKITNQTMELLACIQALKIIQDKIDNGLNVNIIYIYTDSTYLINSITKWYNTWEKNKWKNSKGKDVENIEGAGKNIKLKIKEIIETGNLKVVDNILSNTDIRNDLLNIYGIGPAKAKIPFKKTLFIEGLSNLKGTDSRKKYTPFPKTSLLLTRRSPPSPTHQK
jgi:ribonuclease HI